jgi:hypothetical protein
MTTITPDTKDWTWVLTRPCGECGFDATALDRELVGERLVRAADDLASAIASGEPSRRPRPDVWSPLEYACHVRDVTRVFLERLRMMLDGNDPHFANWDQDRTAVEERYAEQDPAAVAAALRRGAATLAAAFGEVAGDQWRRTGVRSDGARFTVESLGRYLVHDPVHHVWDVTGTRQS